MTTAHFPPQPFQASPLPSTELCLQDDIRFLHPGYPGYPAPLNVLLRLPRVDRTSTGTFGVHYRTALIACQIIGNNAFDTGRLALDDKGQRLVHGSPDGILEESVYYFFVDDYPSQYAVVPSFQDWEFPHDRIPDSWPKPSPSAIRETRCGLTNFSSPLHEALLVPGREWSWYDMNGMRLYGLGAGQNEIDNEVNTIPLKSDVHDIFDNRWFAIVPKTADSGTPQYVSHILSPSAAEFWPSQHNILIKSLYPDSRPYLFARFAWAILLQVKDFICEGLERRVVQVCMDKDL
ncbi:hypothetical protein AAE478_004101 [Parahypoxylon ruwenzoriense]